MGKKIYFKYGVMGSSKSLDLIRAEYNYRERGLNTIVFTPNAGARNKGKIESRIGLSVDAIAVSPTDNIFKMVKDKLDTGTKINAVFIDEIHFVEAIQIDQLAMIADNLKIPVLCYGLRTDFRNELFPASKRLFELADEIEEIKAMCICGSKATCTVRYINGKPTRSGEQFMVGDQEYSSFCRECYNKFFSDK